ncbi:MAG: prenyltransferase [Candidatus Omnitrophica bacterium]|nr:prenyltransferase [Candidatus Omnitrophota bacterium]
MKNKIGAYLMVMRLPFITASAIPFFIGAGYVHYIMRFNNFNVFNLEFFLGLCAAVVSHLGANVFNNYYDSLSGNDLIDSRDHIFFGGSKVILRKLLSEKEVFWTGVFLMGIVGLCVAILQIRIPHIPIVLFGLAIGVLAICYTAPPLKLTYRGLGELVIFILFGPAIVCGAYTVITKQLFGIPEILLSCPMGFLVAAILYGNEVPDHDVDKKAGKNTIIVKITPKAAWIGYLFLILGAAVSIIICVFAGIMPTAALFTLPIFLIFKNPLSIIKTDYNDIEKLKIAAKGTIMGQTLVGIALAIVLFL